MFVCLMPTIIFPNFFSNHWVKTSVCAVKNNSIKWVCFKMIFITRMQCQNRHCYILSPHNPKEHNSCKKFPMFQCFSWALWRCIWCLLVVSDDFSSLLVIQKAKWKDFDEAQLSLINIYSDASLNLESEFAPRVFKVIYLAQSINWGSLQNAISIDPFLVPSQVRKFIMIVYIFSFVLYSYWQSHVLELTHLERVLDLEETTPTMLTQSWAMMELISAVRKEKYITLLLMVHPAHHLIIIGDNTQVGYLLNTWKKFPYWNYTCDGRLQAISNGILRIVSSLLCSFITE